ncbi:MAG TPA: lysophospholipid acyltransferase family protein [Pyrinomonadaceae bacterium]|nr:lysophospholipid acyltransferase family protein [Pyrinomonadaceae bacterium]
MARRLITSILRFALRIFFRRVEVAGLERVPRRGALMFVLNHPNGLIDPSFLLCFAPRPVSFLAKSTLFKMPVIGWLVRAMDAIPVYRRQDEGADVSRNRETFERAAELLRAGGTIGICPEGVSHNETKLQPLKTGAARIALGAASSAGEPLALKIVPAGLYYTAKTNFRSGALLYFGEPFEVGAAALDARGEPERASVQQLTERIAAALSEATFNAEHREAVETVARAERIFSAGDEEEGGRAPTLEQELRRRRRFVEGYAFHRAREPERIAALEARIRRYEEELRQAGLEDPRDLSPSSVSKYARARNLLTRVVLFALLAPVALAGVLLHYPAYWLAGFLATKFSQSYDDVLSTFKLIAATLLFPLTWGALFALVYYLAGWRWALAAVAFAPFAGYAALRFSEELDRTVAGARAALFFVTERQFFKQLLAERRAIRREILALGDEAARAGALE